MAKWMGIEVPFWLLFAIGLGLVLLVSLQAPSSPSSSSSDRATSSNTNTDKSKDRKGEEAPASDDAKEVARRLGVSVANASGRARRRVPVTVCVNDVVLRRSQDGEQVAIDSAIKAIALLNEVASVFLVAWVESDLEEGLMKAVALASGLISPVPPRSTSPPSPPAKPEPQSEQSLKPPASAPFAAAAAGFAAAATRTGIPEHRLLFCSSHVGQVAVVRQLAPSLHIGGPIALLEGICRFVPSLVRIDPSAVMLPPDAHDFATSTEPEMTSETSEEKQASSSRSSGGRNNSSRDGGHELEWREFTSLAAAAGLPSVTSLPTTAENTNNTSTNTSKDDDDDEDNGEGMGTVEAATSTPTSTPGPDAGGVEARQPLPLDVGAISGGGGKFSGSGGVEAETEADTTLGLSGNDQGMS